MEPTSFEILALDYYQKWLASLRTIEAQTAEIESLKNEVTELRRDRYRLLDVIHNQKRK